MIENKKKNIKKKKHTHTHLKTNAIFNDKIKLKKKKPYMNLFCN